MFSFSREKVLKNDAENNFICENALYIGSGCEFHARGYGFPTVANFIIKPLFGITGDSILTDPSFLYSLYLTLYKKDICPRQALRAGPKGSKGVRLRERVDSITCEV